MSNRLAFLGWLHERGALLAGVIVGMIMGGILVYLAAILSGA